MVGEFDTDREVRVGTLAGVIALCYYAKHFALTIQQTGVLMGAREFNDCGVFRLLINAHPI